MQKFQPKTKEQMARIFGLARKHGVEFEDDDTRRGFAITVSCGRVERLSRLSFDEANVLIKNLGGDVFTRGTPKRTVNYHRQQAGVHQIAQGAHLKLMRELAEGRGITEDGLKNLCRRMLKGSSSPRTTTETNKIIEALKAMNARDRVSSDRVSSPHVSKGSTEQEAA